MAKKRFVLFTLVAAFVFVATSGMTSCNKSEVGTQNVPVVHDTLLPPKDAMITAVCPHHSSTDPTRFMVIDRNDPTSIVVHQHEYMEGETCPIAPCEWSGHHHIHEVVFWRGHFEDSWDHLGGCTID